MSPRELNSPHLAQALASIRLQAILDEASATTARILRVDLLGLFELSPDRTRFRLRSGVGWRIGDASGLQFEAAVDLGCGYTMRTGGPVIVDDYSSERRFSLEPLLAEHGVVSGVTVPLSDRGRLLGVLGAFSAWHRKFDSDSALFLTQVARALGCAYGLASQDEERVYCLREQEDRLSILNEGLQKLTLAPSGNAVSRLLLIVNNAAGVSDVSFFRYEKASDALRLDSIADLAPAAPHLVALGRASMVFRRGEERGLVGLVAAARRSLYVSDVSKERSWVSTWPEVRSAYMIPVDFGGRIHGVLRLLSTEVDGISRFQRTIGEIGAAYLAVVLDDLEALHPEALRAWLRERIGIS